ncbi:MAG TPA: ABC transporter ATP-binding protein [Dongiaceae bacterium]|jgi:branched-chain amino acid transport system ATP-binding protein
MTIALRQVRAGYDRDVDVIRGVSVDVSENEIVAVLGPNGAGKSTLLNAIAGLCFARQGEIRIDGRIANHMPMHERARALGIGYVPQTDNVFAPLSVHENLELGGYFLPPAARRQRVDELLAAYPVLAAKERQTAASLSGGERQLVALARALMPRPRYLLLDEPSAGLSPLMLQTVFAEIQSARCRERLGVLLVEQNVAEALSIADRGYVLAMGAIALADSAQALQKDARMQSLYLGGPTD